MYWSSSRSSYDFCLNRLRFQIYNSMRMRFSFCSKKSWGWIFHLNPHIFLILCCLRGSHCILIFTLGLLHLLTICDHIIHLNPKLVHLCVEAEKLETKIFIILDLEWNGIPLTYLPTLLPSYLPTYLYLPTQLLYILPFHHSYSLSIDPLLIEKFSPNHGQID